MEKAQNIMQTFVQQHLPQYVVKIEPIVGGFVNYTFRIHLRNDLHSMPVLTSSHQPLLELLSQLRLSTCVAKLAFPYIALNEVIPYPLSRQRIEESALRLFDSSPLSSDPSHKTFEHLCSMVQQNRAIKIPRILFRDEINNILVMEDLGSLSNAEQWLTSMESSLSTESLFTQNQAYGEQLGAFVADMQVKSLSSVCDLYSLLHNPEQEKSRPTQMHAKLKGFLYAHNVSDADELVSLANQEFSAVSQAATCSKVLAHGDLWTSQISIDSDSRKLCIFDWELASVDSPAQDVARLSSCFQLLVLIYPSNERVLRFVHSCMDAYRETAIKNQVSWYQNEQEKHSFVWSLGVRHALFLILLLWSKKFCVCPQVPCYHTHSIVLIAVDYLKRCRSGPEKATYDLMSSDPVLGRLLQKLD